MFTECCRPVDTVFR